MVALVLHNQKMIRSKQHRRLDGTDSYNQGVRTTTYLPDDVLETIFTFLPIKNTVKIGVLSKRFSKSWLQSRRIIFDRELVRSWGRERVKSVVSQVFNSYRGSEIKCFKLSFDPHDEISIVGGWIKKCIEKCVEELDMDFFIAGRIVVLPYGIFDIESLKTLKLTFCHFNLPPQLKGLKFLSTLILRRVHCASILIETVISNCLCLQTLDMVSCYYISSLKIMAQKLKFFKVLKVGNCLGVNHIDINAPTLLSFHYNGNILRVFRVENVEKLNEVLLNFKPLRSYNIHGQVAKLLRRFSQVSVLTTTGVFLEGICINFMGGVFRFEFSFWNLKELQLLLDCANYCNMYDIISFVRHCPMLEKLFMDFGDYTFENGDYWKLHQREELEKFCDVFNCLKVIKITGFKFQWLELALVKYLLKKANQLESLVLVTQRCNRKVSYTQEVRKHLQDLQMCRACPLTCIEAYERFDDKSFINPIHSHKLWD